MLYAAGEERGSEERSCPARRTPRSPRRGTVHMMELINDDDGGNWHAYRLTYVTRNGIILFSFSDIDLMKQTE